MIDAKVSIPLHLLAKPVSWLYKHGNNAYLKKIKKFSFVFESYTKCLTVYENGHGISLTKMDIKVLDDEKCTTFNRSLSIRDACHDTRFLRLEDMAQADQSKRFCTPGFWHMDDNIVTSIEPILDDCGQDLEWRFIFDKGHLKKLKGKNFPLSYAFSIPRMFPIENGFFNPNIAGAESQASQGHFQSALTVRHKQKELKYIVALEKSIKVIDPPSFCIFPRGEDQGTCEKKTCMDDSDLFYNRYVVTLKSPEVGTKITVRWKIKPTEGE